MNVKFFLFLSLSFLFFSCNQDDEMTNSQVVVPRIIEGRQWEQGIYQAYNTPVTGYDYTFKIGEDLSDVRYLLLQENGQSFGYYMDMTYKQDTLIGNGTTYDDLTEETPVEANTTFEYKNRKSSPGFVFDYDDNTFLGYFNYYKKEGVQGELEGTYESYLHFDWKLNNGEFMYSIAQKIEVIIDAPNSNGDFPANIIEYDANENIESDTTVIFEKRHIENENIMLIKFQNNDYLFTDTLVTYFYPGLITVKE